MKTLIIEDKEFKYKWWENEIMSGKIISFDLETELIQSSLHIPKVSLVMAYDGIQLFLIHPDKLAEFFFKNRNQSFVGHNIQFDFWAAHELMKNKNQIASCRILWDAGSAGRLKDTMILDMLIQLGNGKYRNATGFSKVDEKVYPTNLAVLAKEAGTINLDKTDEYRLRFGELLGMSETEIDNHPESEGFISYALPDVIATYDVYFDVYNKAIKIMNAAGFKDNKNLKKYEIHPDALKKYGPLSEAIQVRGSISLAQLSRTPLNIDLPKRQIFEDEERKLLEEAYEVIEKYNPLLIKRWSKKSKKHVPNSPQLSPKTGLKCISDIQLKITLMEECQRLNITKIPISDGKKKDMSTSAKDWSKYSEESEFIKYWCAIEKHAKMLQFLVNINHPQIYTNYNLLMKTGRTSASSHRTRKDQEKIPSVNIQQIPRDGRMRELFIAPPNLKWFICDYGFIELCTLAATCKACFGFSALGNAITKYRKCGGLDPHEVMAAALLNVTQDNYVKLPKDEKKKARQAAKAVNFGNPGGLGKTKLVAYALNNYNVVMTETEAKKAKEKWLETYPEMKLHLCDVSDLAVAFNLKCKVSDVRKLFPKDSKWSDKLRSLKDGLYNDKGEGELTEKEIQNLNKLLTQFRPDLIELLKDKSTWRDLHEELFLYRSNVLTGRVKGKAGYCDGKNASFQGSASDGGKESIWQLMYKGYKPICFIHDEIICEVNPKTAKDDAKRIESIMCKTMESVIGHGIPVACEGHLSSYWVK
jgi:DNA polymerase I-like protein with 3'-5' exonuclease and polymerase domains